MHAFALIMKEKSDTKQQLKHFLYTISSSMISYKMVTLLKCRLLSSLALANKNQNSNWGRKGTYVSS